MCDRGDVAVIDAAGSGWRGAGARIRWSTRGRAIFRAMQVNFAAFTDTRAVAPWLSTGFDTLGRLPVAFRHPV